MYVMMVAFVVNMTLRFHTLILWNENDLRLCVKLDISKAAVSGFLLSTATQGLINFFAVTGGRLLPAWTDLALCWLQPSDLIICVPCAF